jgi:hypothetical protein
MEYLNNQPGFSALKSSRFVVRLQNDQNFLLQSPGFIEKDIVG